MSDTGPTLPATDPVGIVEQLGHYQAQLAIELQAYASLCRAADPDPTADLDEEPSAIISWQVPDVLGSAAIHVDVRALPLEVRGPFMAVLIDFHGQRLLDLVDCYLHSLKDMREVLAGPVLPRRPPDARTTPPPAAESRVDADPFAAEPEFEIGDDIAADIATDVKPKPKGRKTR